MLTRRIFIEACTALAGALKFGWAPTESKIHSLRAWADVAYVESYELGRYSPYNIDLAFPIDTTIEVVYKGEECFKNQFQAFNIITPEIAEGIIKKCVRPPHFPCVVTNYELKRAFEDWNEKWKDLNNIPSVFVRNREIKLISVECTGDEEWEARHGCCK